MRNQLIRWDGDDLYWSELRPSEGGRIAVCRRAADGAITDVTPPGFNARSRVHEYGGGHYAVKDGSVYFTNYKDQRLYRVDGGGAPRPITPEADIRHADMLVDTARERVFAVREDHTTGAPEAVNTIVALDVNGKRDAITVASGNDFYSTPKLSPDGERLAWQTWNHPNMPWDGSEIWVGELDREGNVVSSRKKSSKCRTPRTSSRATSACPSRSSFRPSTARPHTRSTTRRATRTTSRPMVRSRRWSCTATAVRQVRPDRRIPSNGSTGPAAA